MERRDFVKASALAAATAVASDSSSTAQAQPTKTPDGVAWDKAPCRFCGTGCHVRVGVKEGQVVAIAGERRAEVNKGLLCVKGYHVGLALYGKDRLKYPMLRVDGNLTRISWDEALSIIADRVEAAPQRFAIYGSGQWTIPEGYAAQKLMRAGVGSNHLDPNARLCMASAVTGFLATYGVDEPAGCYDDLDACDVLILWGNNPAEMHPVLFSRVIDRRARGEKVEIIDLTTRRTRSSEFADHVLQFVPHTDLAIANGVAHLLLEREQYDAEFVRKHCNFKVNSDPVSLHGEKSDFEAYKKALEPYTPEYVAKISGVPAEQVRMLADRFGDPKLRITSLWCMGMNQHTRGTAINTLVHGIHLLSGHFGKPGDAPTSLTGQPSACGTVREVGTLAHALPGGRLIANEAHRRESEKIWQVPEGRIPAKPGFHTVKMWENFIKPKSEGGAIDTIWVQVTNPGQTLPNRKRLFERKPGDGKFLIVSEVYPTASTQLADLVLPSAMWVEKNGVVGNSERRTQQWFKMVEPPGEARDDAWQLIAMARKLYDRGFSGMKRSDGSFLFHMNDDEGREVPVWRWSEYYSINVDQRLFDEYRKFTRLKHKDLAPYAEYVKAVGLRWPVVEQSDGSWRETKFRFAEFDDPYVKKGQGIEFYHSSTKDGRAQIWFHPYEAPPEVPDEAYPFWLCTGRVIEHWHSGTMTMRIEPLRRAVPHAYVEVHRNDARRLGIVSGQKVELETRRGKLQIPAWIDGRGKAAEGSLFVPFFDESMLINDLTLHDFDPISKQPDYKKCACKLSKVG